MAAAGINALARASSAATAAPRLCWSANTRGTAFYQSIYGPRRGLLESLPLMRVRFWPPLAPSVLALITLLGSGAVGALLTHAGTAAAVLAALALMVLLRALYESGRGIAAVQQAVSGIAALEAPDRCPRT